MTHFSCFRSYRRALIFALALSPAAAYAQPSVPAPPSPLPSVVVLPARSSPLDLRLPSADDQHRRDAVDLFHRRRTGGAVWSLVGGVLFIATFASASNQGIEVVPALLSGLIQGGIPIGIGLGKLSRFSKEREAEALGAYDNAGALPRYVERRID